jgi:hypothetical protein
MEQLTFDLPEARTARRVRQPRGRVDDHGRECPACGVYKPWSDFPLAAKGPRGHNSNCRQCLHDRYRAKSSAPERVACVIDDEGRECVVCRTYKPWDDFPPHAKGSHGRSWQCRPCVRAAGRAWSAEHPEGRARLKLRSQAALFGLDPDMIEVHFMAHSGLCDICGRRADEANTRVKRLSIDHDHDSGAFRGLLCGSCNTGLGSFRDDTKLLAGAIKYLIQAKKEEARHEPALPLRC